MMFRRTIPPFVALLLLLAVGSAFGEESDASAKQQKFETGCVAGCLEDEGVLQTCERYCGCAGREMFTGRSSARWPGGRGARARDAEPGARL